MNLGLSGVCLIFTVSVVGKSGLGRTPGLAAGPNSTR
jgi:hypothetical protein